MIRYRATAKVFGVWLTVAASGLLAGCQDDTLEIEIVNHRIGPLTVAVAPALNSSGSADFDPNAVADIMANELVAVEHVEVIPVSRVLAVLADEGFDQVVSPEHAEDLVARLGADAIILFAVTEYDPYFPPNVGISAQLYGTRRFSDSGGLDPVRVSREARPGPATRSVATFGPLAQSTREFNSRMNSVEEQVKAFARSRQSGDSPYGWELYLRSQERFLEYCCHATLVKLFEGRHGVAATREED